MSYQVLARKWRPRNFQEMVGQEHILRMLTNALDDQRLHHAYLFTGTRGVGKTTLARIFAKCLNCEAGITSLACGTCSTCQAIDAGKFLDLIEVDAASRTRVEDTRELLDNVQYMPTQGRFKIYLIDEVHMLSGHSFNALLKTLEEPPAYVKFLLATTDPKRLPITILSRCLQFNLHPVSVEKITEQLVHISTTENIQFELAALQLIAHAADGSVRDALSLLDQTIAFCRNNITTLDTRRMLGCVEQDSIFNLLNALVNQDGKQLLAEITYLAEQAPDFNQLLEDVLSILHKISIMQIIPDATPDAHEKIVQLAKTLAAEDTQLFYQIALIGRRDLPLAATPQQGFEMTMLRMLAFRPAVIESKQPTSQQPIKKEDKPILQDMTAQNWTEIIAKLELTGMALALATHCALTQLSPNSVELTLAAKHAALLTTKLHERIESALSRYFNTAIKLQIKTATDELNTPAQKQQQEDAMRHADATVAIKNNSHVNTIIDLFNATLDVGSIKAV
jgi:DNA polymerase-3 subunit gamma/tau